MRYFLILASFCTILSTAALAEDEAVSPVDGQQYRQQMQEVQQYMKSPQYQEQMKMMQQMQANPETANQMMSASTGMSECMDKNVGKQGLDKMAAQSQAMEKAVADLCKAGKRDDAQKLGIAWGKKMMDEPEFKAMSDCSQQYASQLNEQGQATMKEQIQKIANNQTRLCP